MPTQKSFDQLLIFVNLYQHAKNPFIPFIHFSDAANFKAPSHDWPRPFWTISTPKTSMQKNKLIPLLNSILESSNQIDHIKMLKMRLFNQFAREK